MTDDSLAAEAGGALSDLTALADELDASGGPLDARISSSLRAFADAAAHVADGTAEGFPDGLPAATGAHLVLLDSYDLSRRSLLALLQLAGAFEDTGDGYAGPAEQVQALASQLVPALEAIRGGLHPIVALAALLVEQDGEALVLPAGVLGELEQALDLLAQHGKDGAGSTGLQTLARHLAVRPGGEAAAQSLDLMLAGRA
ncbi:MAG TPA: hypothetical protein VGM10_28315 [Actinocrinis sp.]|jgi:hypothetical protein